MSALRLSPHLAPETVARARRLRREMTPAERALRAGLRRTFPALHFRSQVPFGPYYADFACHGARVVIEIDGSQHAEAVEYDASRTAFLESEGYRVLRFWNNQVLRDLDAVLTAIGSVLPSPLVGVLARPRSKRCPVALLNHAGGMIYLGRAKTGGPPGRMGGARRKRAPA